MDSDGVYLCSRFAFPPNALSLCGPNRQSDLGLYAQQREADSDVRAILQQFSTLYPYLSFIAYENNIRDPFDRRVVEAYWLGNNLLHNVKIRNFATYLTDTLMLKKKLPRLEAERLLEKLDQQAMPHHSFHVFNVYRRTGHSDENHTLQTMEACIINWGTVETIMSNTVIVTTRPVIRKENALAFGNPIKRSIDMPQSDGTLRNTITVGDTIAYHWGRFCTVLSDRQARNLKHYTIHSMLLANQTLPCEQFFTPAMI